MRTLVEQAEKLTLSSGAFCNDKFPVYAEQLTSMFGYDMVLPMNTGAEGVEAALKLARKWGYEKKKIPKNEPEDRFLIFASDGLWERLSCQEAFNIVNSNPCHGITKRLIEATLQVAARKREMRYADLRKIDVGVRRHFHDDIIVVVLFLDQRS
ncbi:hypothetical protein Droror1_Dr00004921 [Drosera rotundifolia]